MSEINPCAKCSSFAVQSIDIMIGGYYCHCFNEHSSDSFECDAPSGPRSQNDEQSIVAWNDLNPLPLSAPASNP